MGAQIPVVPTVPNGLSTNTSALTVGDMPPMTINLGGDEGSVDEQEEQWQALQHCLKRLSDEQRSCIIRFFLKEMSYADIAKQTGWTLSNIKSFIQNGKRNLKICIKKQQLL